MSYGAKVSDENGRVVFETDYPMVIFIDTISITSSSGSFYDERLKDMELHYISMSNIPGTSEATTWGAAPVWLLPKLSKPLGSGTVLWTYNLSPFSGSIPAGVYNHTVIYGGIPK